MTINIYDSNKQIISKMIIVIIVIKVIISMIIRS